MMTVTPEVYEPHYPLRYAVDGVESFVTVGQLLAEQLAEFITRQKPYRLCVISDTTVARKFQASLWGALSQINEQPTQYWHLIEPGEASKTLAVANDCLESILPHMTRDSLIIAFGGGVVGNLAGTVASLLFRGCPFIHLPTTFMAQADSAIGIKQSVNATLAKNAYGAYHVPLAVFNDIYYLKTLPPNEWRNGLAESIKVAMARSPAFVRGLKTVLRRFPDFSDADIYWLLEETIYPKVAALSADPRERDYLLFLEIGHTLGHAIERASSGQISHGYAIALGMLIETRLGIEMGITNSEVYYDLAELLGLLNFPTRIPENIPVEQIINCLLCDNRRIATGPVFVFLRSVGDTVVRSGVDISLIYNILEENRDQR